MPDEIDKDMSIKDGFFLITFNKEKKNDIKIEKYDYRILFDKYLIMVHSGVGYGLIPNNIVEFVPALTNREDNEQVDYNTKSQTICLIWEKIKYLDELKKQITIEVGTNFGWSHREKGWLYKFYKNNLPVRYVKKLWFKDYYKY